MSKSERVVLVTGASRGAGKGIALALGAKGDIVYVTGRSENEGDAPLPGTVRGTAEQITALGGRGVGVLCDHNSDEQVAALIDRIRTDHGRLDILVNNATHIHDDLVKPGGFWTKSIDLAKIIDVGLRSTYTASYYAAPLLIAQEKGLIVNTSSFGARCYMHGPAYGAQKAGIDKMTWDMAHDLKPYNVAAVSIWMGILKTERTKAAAEAAPELYAALLENAETPEFTGLLIDALYHAPDRMSNTGRTLVGAELAETLNIQDTDGRQPPSHSAMLGTPVEFSSAVVE